MNVLLDTHVWIWWLTGQDDLPKREKKRLDELATHHPPFLSDISLWEAQMMAAKGRLQLSRPFAQWLIEATLPDVVRLVRLSPEVILQLDNLPSTFHGDPADRIIAATALALDIPLCTHDKLLRKSKVVRLWN